MSYYICGQKWMGRDDKEHSCQVKAKAGHEGDCHCDCGAVLWSKKARGTRTPIDDLLARTKRRRAK